MPQHYVALLRGVNVGKGVRVPMKDLKASLEGLGLSDVVPTLGSLFRLNLARQAA